MDVVIIGGGPAGLQAALTLGRMHRDALLLDSGSYRNAAAGHMHNFVTHDGRPPEEFREMARADLASYDTVEVRDCTALEVRRRSGGGFETVLADGSVVGSDAVLLATGVRDVLPDVPGMAEAFGTHVHHCPFCHGHELAGKTVAIQEARADHLVPMLSRIAEDVRVVSGLEKVVIDGDEVLLTTADGEVRAGGLFAATEFEQAAPFAEQLGLDVLESGCVEVDAMGRTSVQGVYAAGDMAHTKALAMPMASVLTAAATGLVAAAASVGDSLTHSS